MKRIIALILILIALLSFSSCREKINPYDYRDDDSLTAYFFDVGQADCSLLLFPDDTVMLIDCGNRADGNKISQFIKNLDIDTIDYLVLSHPHEDHIGGATEIFNNFEILSLCFPQIPNVANAASDLYNEVFSAANKEKSRLIPLTSDMLVVEKSDFNVMAISPVQNCIYSDLNDYSLTLLINFYTNTLLFTGDAEQAAEADILKTDINLHTDILKVGHHGAETSTTEAFLKAAKPQVAVISSGKNNSYKHPHDETLLRLKNANVKTYRTDTAGTVIARCYNKGFSIETNQHINLDGN